MATVSIDMSDGIADRLAAILSALRHPGPVDLIISVECVGGKAPTGFSLRMGILGDDREVVMADRNLSVRELGLPARITNSLWRANIRTVGELLMKLEPSFEAFCAETPNIGLPSVIQILRTLEDRGYRKRP